MTRKINFSDGYSSETTPSEDWLKHAGTWSSQNYNKGDAVYYSVTKSYYVPK